MTIQNDSTVTTTFDSSLPCVHQVWHGFARSDQFRTATKTVIDFVQKNNRQYPHIQFLVDSRKLGPLSREDTEWAAREADPLLFKAGMRRIAFIVPQKMVSEMALKNYQRVVEENSSDTIQSQIFGDETQARQWLKL